MTGSVSNRRRRSVTTAAVLSTTGLLLAACGSQSVGSAGGSSASIATNPSGTLQILVSSAPGSNAGFRAVDAAFEKKYPKVHIVFSTIPNADFATAQSTRESAGRVDLTTVSTQAVPSYVNQDAASSGTKAALAGDYVDLKKQPFESKLTTAVQTAIALDGKQYVFPLGFSYYTGAFYNKAIFAKYHLSIPTTWGAFLKLSNTLRHDGVTPIGNSGQGLPQGPMLAAVQSLYPTYADRVNLNKGLWKKTIKLTDPKPVEVLQRTQQVWSYSEPNWTGVPWASVFAGFGKGKYAMLPDGTWDTDALASANPSLKFGYFPLPISDNAADNSHLGGKVDLSLSIPTKSHNVGTALAYLKFMAEPANYALFDRDSGFSPAESGIPLSGFLKSLEKYTLPFSPAWDTIWNPNPTAGVAATYPFNYAELAPLGKYSTPAAAAAAAQKAWAGGA